MNVGEAGELLTYLLSSPFGTDGTLSPLRLRSDSILGQCGQNISFYVCVALFMDKIQSKILQLSHKMQSKSIYY